MTTATAVYVAGERSRFEDLTDIEYQVLTQLEVLSDPGTVIVGPITVAALDTLAALGIDGERAWVLACDYGDWHNTDEAAGDEPDGEGHPYIAPGPLTVAAQVHADQLLDRIRTDLAMAS